MNFKKIALVSVACFAMSSAFADPFKSATVTDKDGNSISISLQSVSDAKFSGEKVVFDKNHKMESVTGEAKLEFKFDGKPVTITGSSISVQ